MAAICSRSEAAAMRAISSLRCANSGSRVNDQPLESGEMAQLDA